MRVISGRSRGLKLLSPEGLDTRPTTDRVKESMFNLIMPYIPKENVLDLFAGSGALGIEALSRGCGHCVFLETNPSSLLILKKNIEHAKQQSISQARQEDALTYLSSLNNKFDIIFLDPPYNKGLLTKSIEIIYNKNLLSEGGIIVAECEVGGEVPPINHFDILKSAKYGKTMVFVLGVS